MRGTLQKLRALDQAWNKRAWNSNAALLDEDLVAFVSGEERPHGKAAHVDRALAFCETFPDAMRHPEYLDLFASADGRHTLSVVRFTGTAMSLLQLPGPAPTVPTARGFDVPALLACHWRADASCGCANISIRSSWRASSEAAAISTPAWEAHMADVQQNERTAMAQEVAQQPDGPGLRIGKRGEIVMIADVAPGGAALFRERMPQFQAEAAYWEGRVGTVQDFRILLFDNDTRVMLLVTYDGDFKPYLVDIATQAHEWLDSLANGVLADFPGISSPDAGRYISERLIQSDFFYVAHPDVTVRDVAKMKRLRDGFSEMLDAAS